MDPYLEKLQRKIAAAVTSLSMDQLSWHPPGKWCVAEILEHLYLTYTGTTKGLERVTEAGKPLTALPTWKNRMQAAVVIGFGYLPSGRKSPPVARPRGLRAQQVLAEIGLKIAEMDAIMTQCEAKFGARTRILDHPILGPLSVAQWRKFHLVHGMHHVRQIRRIAVTM